jgi:hypothetical protein
MGGPCSTVIFYVLNKAQDSSQITSKLHTTLHNVM